MLLRSCVTASPIWRGCDGVDGDNETVEGHSGRPSPFVPNETSLMRLVRACCALPPDDDDGDAVLARLVAPDVTPSQLARATVFCPKRRLYVCGTCDAGPAATLAAGANVGATTDGLGSPFAGDAKIEPCQAHARFCLARGGAGPASAAPPATKAVRRARRSPRSPPLQPLEEAPAERGWWGAVQSE